MRKFFALALGVSLWAHTSFASDSLNQEAYYDNEGAVAGLVSEADLQQMAQDDSQFMNRQGEAIAGSIIGGIIGAVAADAWDNGFRGPGHGPGPGFGPGPGPRPGPGGPGYRPGRPGPGPGRDPWVTCFAQNRRGQVFSATGRHARFAQDQAIDQCYRFSAFCRPLGCR